jgi:hypothetical protein
MNRKFKGLKMDDLVLHSLSIDHCCIIGTLQMALAEVEVVASSQEGAKDRTVTEDASQTSMVE